MPIDEAKRAGIVPAVTPPEPTTPVQEPKAVPSETAPQAFPTASSSSAPSTPNKADLPARKKRQRCVEPDIVLVLFSLCSFSISLFGKIKTEVKGLFQSDKTKSPAK